MRQQIVVVSGPSWRQENSSTRNLERCHDVQQWATQTKRETLWCGKRIVGVGTQKVRMGAQKVRDRGVNDQAIMRAISCKHTFWSSFLKCVRWKSAAE